MPLGERYPSLAPELPGSTINTQANNIQKRQMHRDRKTGGCQGLRERNGEGLLRGGGYFGEVIKML